MAQSPDAMVPQSRMPVVCSSTMHPFPYKQPVGVTTSVHSLASTAKSTTMSSCGSILARTMKTIRGNERVATPPRVGMSYYAAVISSSECRWKRRPTVAQRGHVSASQGDWVATVERRRRAQARLRQIRTQRQTSNVSYQGILKKEKKPAAVRGASTHVCHVVPARPGASLTTTCAWSATTCAWSPSERDATRATNQRARKRSHTRGTS